VRKTALSPGAQAAKPCAWLAQPKACRCGAPPAAAAIRAKYAARNGRLRAMIRSVTSAKTLFTMLCSLSGWMLGSSKGKQSGAFLKKSTKKLLRLWAGAVPPAPPHGNQKFFGYFFSKK
jgi:hypothetical protein